MSYLEIIGACKSFGALKALDRVSLSVAKGSFLTLLGPSGCGKTTLLRSIAGLQSLDSGSIEVDGRPLDPSSGGPRAVLVFQDYALFPHMSVRQNVSYGLRLRRLRADSIRDKVDATLSYLGIGELDGRMPAELSGGQQQRVALARALIMEPEVLLLDEPLSNLDAKLRLGIRSELKRIQQELGVTTVYVTHDQGEALSLSDRVAVMDRGRLVQQGEPREIYFRPADAFVADFVGAANILDAEILEADDSSIKISAFGLSWDLEGKFASERADRVISICIRPEFLGLSKIPDPRSLSGVVAQKMFEGSHVRYWIDVEGTTFVADDAAMGAEYPLKSRVWITFAAEGFHILGKGVSWTKSGLENASSEGSSQDREDSPSAISGVPV